MSSHSNSFTVISTFAGCGGSSLGYQMAGGVDLAAVEYDHHAAETYRLNFPGVPVIERDIAIVTAQELLDLTGLGIGQLDILDGSPPCQGFSTAGKRQVSDPRNSLFKEYIRLLEGLQPKVLVMENVSGMVKGKMKWVFAQILIALKEAGYDVSCRLLNAMYFGVPQSRARVIFIGVRKDLGIKPSHPRPHGPVITVREAWAGLPSQTEAGRKLSPRYCAYWQQARPGGSVGKLRAARKLKWNRPSYTLTQTEGNGGVYHPSECRGLSILEMARLQSIPDEFQFPASIRDNRKVIGNAVPPLMMKAIAEHIRDNILAKL